VVTTGANADQVAVPGRDRDADIESAQGGDGAARGGVVTGVDGHYATSWEARVPSGHRPAMEDGLAQPVHSTRK